MAEKLRVETTLEIEESGAEQYPSLKDAQDAALGPLADVLAGMIRSGLDKGRYVVEDGAVRERKEVRHE